MLYRKIPKTGDELSILGFGCMRLPTGPDGAVDEPRAIRLLRDAIDRGVNYLDTAWPYHAGASENVVGRALRDGYRERVRLATKLPCWQIKTREDMDRYLDAQLTKLQTDRIDYYLLHALNGASWDRMEALGARDFLDAARADGRIRNAGFSFHGKVEDFKRIVDAYPWIMCLIQYNFLDTEYQAGTEGLEFAAARDLGVIVMEPLRGGSIGQPTPPPEVAAIWARAATKRTPVAWALRWIWNRPEVTAIISGMNEEAHVAENIAVAEHALPGSLTADDLSLVGEAAAKFKELMRVHCTSCGYCLPCPEGVKIPLAFELYNKLHLFGGETETKFMYAWFCDGDPAGYASRCVNCGECLEKCPQDLPIPDLLADVAADLEDENLEAYRERARKSFNVEPPD